MWAVRPAFHGVGQSYVTRPAAHAVCLRGSPLSTFEPATGFTPGWLAAFKDQAQTMDTSPTLTNRQGLIISKTTGAYGVQTGDQTLSCAVAVLPRRNQLARRGVPSRPGAHTFEQVIAANVDQVAPVFAAANPAPKWNLLDRYLAVAGALDLPALILVTKADLAPAATAAADALRSALDEYRRLGYRVFETSAQTSAGLDDLRAALGGRVTLLLGKSGVGKTSLLNALEPGLGLRVSAVSAATGKGRHTTTQVQLCPLAGQPAGGVIDTPGTREFGLWDIDPADLALFFPEMRPLVGRCKFGLDCRHDEEPGCAIRQAVLSGAISPRRYQSYQRLRSESD